jgi:hypothetical protein
MLGFYADTALEPWQNKVTSPIHDLNDLLARLFGLQKFSKAQKSGRALDYRALQMVLRRASRTYNTIPIPSAAPATTTKIAPEAIK